MSETKLILLMIIIFCLGQKWFGSRQYFCLGQNRSCPRQKLFCLGRRHRHIFPIFSYRCTQIKTYSWDNAQVILVGNKCDMEDERVISFERGKHLADSLGLEFFETSAKDNINVRVSSWICSVEWWRLWNFTLVQMKFNTVLYPNKHPQRIFWYLWGASNGEPYKFRHNFTK